MKNSILLGVTLRVSRKDWNFNLQRVKITYFFSICVKFQTAKSEFSLCKEWNFYYLFRVKFSVFSQCSLSTIPFSWFSFMFIKFKHTSIERDCTEGTLYKKRLKISLWTDWNFTLCRVKNSLFTVWNFTRMQENKWISLLVDWNVNLFDWPEESLQGG